MRRSECGVYCVLCDFLFSYTSNDTLTYDNYDNNHHDDDNDEDAFILIESESCVNRYTFGKQVGLYEFRNFFISISISHKKHDTY